MPDRVREILDYYRGDNLAVLGKLAMILNHGILGGTGRIMILPVDQDMEHGPAPTFGPNPVMFDPHAIFELALKAGFSAVAMPKGALQAAAGDFPGAIPMICKLNSSTYLNKSGDAPTPAVYCSVEEALQIGSAAIGYTIYPGSANFTQTYENAQALVETAKRYGLAAVIWSYPRGSGLGLHKKGQAEGKKANDALDVVGYAARIAAQLGADIIKVKPPTELIVLDNSLEPEDMFAAIPHETLAERVAYVVQCAFDGHRIVIFSGGAKKGAEGMLETNRQIHKGGGFGTIQGRNSIQRPESEAVPFIGKIMDIYADKE